jgi:apolipoprotein D and lipocalin family protein
MIRILVVLALLSLSLGCSKNHKTVESLDLNKFMGSWYVIAILPNFIEKNAVNGVESYALNSDGTIGITYKFRKGNVQGKEKVMKPRAKVYNKSTNAEWRVQFFKPFWYPYLVIDLADDYRYTVIGVPNRKFVWIMSRTSSITDEDYANIISKLQAEGYKTEKIKKMPQIW